MKVVILQYNAGNIRSVIFALERLGLNPVLTDDPELIRGADKVIFPGQGEANSAMKYLKARGLDQLIRDLQQPFLGICLGMQLMCSYSEENDTPCLGMFENKVRRFIPLHPEEKVPQMGWNLLKDLKGPLFQNLPDEPFVYFVHSYYVELGTFTTARADYIHPFTAALEKDNFYATQFHPEKSGIVGAKILENFLSIPG